MVEKTLDPNLMEFIERELDLEQFKIEIAEMFPIFEERIIIYLLYFGVTLKEIAHYVNKDIPFIRARVAEFESKMLTAWDIEPYDYDEDLWELRARMFCEENDIEYDSYNYDYSEEDDEEEYELDDEQIEELEEELKEKELTSDSEDATVETDN